MLTEKNRIQDIQLHFQGLFSPSSFSRSSWWEDELWVIFSLWSRVYFRGPKVFMRTFSLLVRHLHVLLEILFFSLQDFLFSLRSSFRAQINERGDTGNLANAEVTN